MSIDQDGDLFSTLVYTCLQKGCRCFFMVYIPSGKHTNNSGNSPFLLGKLTISMAILTMAMLSYQRVYKMVFYWLHGIYLGIIVGFHEHLVLRDLQEILGNCEAQMGFVGNDSDMSTCQLTQTLRNHQCLMELNLPSYICRGLCQFTRV